MLYLQLVPIFFFNDTATTEIYTLSLHDALPISGWRHVLCRRHDLLSSPQPESRSSSGARGGRISWRQSFQQDRSEEHTSELQSRLHLVCRLLLEKKKKNDEVD